MAVYCLLLDLPTFLRTLKYSDQEIANLQTSIDVGAILGSMTLGFISDRMHGKRSPVSLIAVTISIAVSFTVYSKVYSMSKILLDVMMFLLGFFISGLNNMISSACAADLGKQEALKGNTKAISTVTGIIDGTGSLGTAVGLFILSFTVDPLGWQNGYLLVVAIDITITAFPILKIVYEEYKELKIISKSKKALGMDS